MPMPTKARRYTAQQILHTNTVHLAVVKHELWRLSHTEKDCFTEKELAYLQKTCDDFDAVLARLGKLGVKVQRSL